MLDRLSISASDTARVAQVQIILNQQYLQLAASEELQVGAANVSVPANATNASLPSAVTGIKYLVNGSVAMQPITLIDLAGYLAESALGSAPVPSVAPIYYAFEAPTTIAVWPSPTASVTLTGLFVQSPTTMSAGTDTPSAMPSAWHDLLAEMTVQRMAISEDDLWPQFLGDQIVQQMIADFRAWRMQAEGPGPSVIPLKRYAY